MNKYGSHFVFHVTQNSAHGTHNKDTKIFNKIILRASKVMLPNMLGAWWLNNAPEVHEVAMLVVALAGAKLVCPWNSFTSVFLCSVSVFFSDLRDPVGGELSPSTAFALSHSTISLNFSFEYKKK